MSMHELAFPAVQELGGIRRLLVGTLADRAHLVHRRQIAEKQDRLEIAVPADLTLIDDDAAAGSCRAR